MASVINQIKIGTVEYAIAHSALATCNTQGATAAKTADIVTDGDTTNNEFALITGVTINVFFSATNSVNTPTLQVGNTVAKLIVTPAGSPIYSNELSAGLHTFMYDGSYWRMLDCPAVCFATWEASDI